jgi:hypothetical protein
MKINLSNNYLSNASSEAIGLLIKKNTNIKEFYIRWVKNNLLKIELNFITRRSFNF